MARKKKQKTPDTSTPPKPRSTLHQVLAGRKGGQHRRRSEKRAAQKLRRELDE